MWDTGGLSSSLWLMAHPVIIIIIIVAEISSTADSAVLASTGFPLGKSSALLCQLDY